MPQYGHQISGRPLLLAVALSPILAAAGEYEMCQGPWAMGGVPTRSLRASWLGTERRWREGVGGEEHRCSDACVAALGRG